MWHTACVAWLVGTAAGWCRSTCVSRCTEDPEQAKAAEERETERAAAFAARTYMETLVWPRGFHYPSHGAFTTAVRAAIPGVLVGTERKDQAVHLNVTYPSEPGSILSFVACDKLLHALPKGAKLLPPAEGVHSQLHDRCLQERAAKLPQSKMKSFFKPKPKPTNAAAAASSANTQPGRGRPHRNRRGAGRPASTVDTGARHVPLSTRTRGVSGCGCGCGRGCTHVPSARAWQHATAEALTCVCVPKRVCLVCVCPPHASARVSAQVRKRQVRKPPRRRNWTPLPSSLPTPRCLLQSTSRTCLTDCRCVCVARSKTIG